MRTLLRDALMRMYSGASFDSGALKAAAPLINFVDRRAQRFGDVPRDLSIPSFALRARSNGINRQLGGRRFVTAGQNLVDFFVEEKLVQEGHTVLEVGCGVGRYPLFLKREFNDLNYIGLDIDKASIDHCQAVLADAQYRFELLDIRNGIWNPQGSIDPNQVTFSSVGDQQADLVFLWSVFTHMELEHIDAYFREFSRVLAPGGRVVCSVFIYDERPEMQSRHRFEHNGGMVLNPDRPMKAIAFPMDELERSIAQAGLVLDRDPIRKETERSFGQDLLVLRAAGS